MWHNPNLKVGAIFGGPSLRSGRRVFGSGRRVFGSGRRITYKSHNQSDK
jgi:hypothetical protein